MIFQYKLDDENTIEFRFDYSESCKNVYKHCVIYVNDTKKDIRLLKKHFTNLPEILSKNCYFWKPCQAANSRRYKERKINGEIKDWALKQGFVLISNICNY